MEAEKLNKCLPLQDWQHLERDLATIGRQHREAAVLCPSEEKSSNDLLSMCLISFSSVQNKIIVKQEIVDRLRYADM